MLGPSDLEFVLQCDYNSLYEIISHHVYILRCHSNMKCILYNFHPPTYIYIYNYIYICIYIYIYVYICVCVLGLVTINLILIVNFSIKFVSLFMHVSAKM